MRKSVLSLGQAQPAIQNMLQDMKHKYASRKINFLPIATASEEDITNQMPTSVKQYLSTVKHTRKVGHEQGIEFYYFYLQDPEGKESFLLPILIFCISREDNEKQVENRALFCSLDTYLPKITQEDVEIDSLLEYFIKNNRG